MTNTYDILKGVYFFSALKDADIRCIEQVCTRTHFEAGEIIISEGEPGDKFYIIANGQVEIWKGYRENYRDLFAVYNNGQVFGEISLVDNLPRTATVIAKTSVSLLVVASADFSRIIAESNAISRSIMKSITVKVRESNETFIRGLREKSRKLQDAEKRLARSHDALERKVQERNTELLQVIENLKKEIEERKQAQKTLEEMEERYRFLAQATMEAIFLSERGFCLEANRAASEMFGYTPEELEGIYLTELVAPEYQQMVLEQILSKTEAPHEAMAMRKDGTVFSGEVKTRHMVFRGKRIRVTAVRDITEQKESQARFRLAAQIASDLIFEWHLHSDIVEWFGEVDTILGYPKEEIPETAAGWLELIHPHDKERIYANWEKKNYQNLPGKRNADKVSRLTPGKDHDTDARKEPSQGQEAFVRDGVPESMAAQSGVEPRFFHEEIRIQDKEGNLGYWEINAIPLLDPNCKEPKWLGICSNITRYREAENALRISERKFKELYEESERAKEMYSSLLTSSADAIVIYDMQGCVEYVNPVFTELFGWDATSILGKRIPYVPDSETEPTDCKIQALIREGTPCHGFITKRKTKDGRLLDVSISASRYHNASGQPSGMLVILRDISEIKRMEAQIQRTRRVEAIATLAGGIAHNFNNLLMGIQGNVSLMLLNTDPNHPNIQKLKNIEKNIETGARLTRQLIGYAREGKYTAIQFDLALLIRETAETFGMTRKDIRVHMHLDKELCQIMADRSQIEQVLMDILVNAGDAMEEGGDLFIEAANLSVSVNQKSTQEVSPGNYVRITIQDTGAGMEKEVLDQIFEPFFTTKEVGKGTGLGLSSAFGTIKGHGGNIIASSETGVGSVFTIFLPALCSASKKQETKQKAIAKGTETILLVDDEETIIEVGEQLLSLLGYEVITARNGLSALDIFQQEKDRIDLVILDIIMPDMNGVKTCELLKAQDPDIPVLLSSGYGLNEKAEELIQKGCAGFIQKPFTVTELSQSIRNILAGHPS